MSEPEYTIYPVEDEEAWIQARAIREVVFIQEQSCPPEEEWDAFDDTSRHFLCYVDRVPVGVARWRVAYHDGRAVAKLERFAVLRHHRGNGYGRALVRALIEDAAAAGFDTCYLHAQAYLEEFYRSFGFETVTGLFMEAGIAHVGMLRRPKP